MSAGAGAGTGTSAGVGTDASAGFGSRLANAFAEFGHLCVGIDPHSYLLSEWGLPDTAVGAKEFGLRVVAASAGNVGILKPQVAFFERFGAAGYAALERVLAEGREAGLVVIADVKRGDIGTSIDAYARAWLTPGSALESDAMTVSAYQGVGSLEGPMAFARSAGKGLFVLAATSNPEAATLQRAIVQSEPVAGMSVARAIIDGVAAHNLRSGETGPGSMGVVLGATADLVSFGIDTADERLAQIPVLAPGFGTQGAQLDRVSEIYGLMTPSVIVTESRGILKAGPTALAMAVSRRAAEVADALG